MYYYFNLFLINSFLGFLFETSLKTFFFPDMHNGILFGPWIPVYGFGAVIICLVFRFIFKHFKVCRLWKTVILFFSVFLLLSFLEWVGGMLIETIFHKEFWNYRNQKYNLGPYISLGMSLLWGGISLLFVYVILPLEEKIIKKIPRFFTVFVFFFLLLDCLFTYFLVS